MTVSRMGWPGAGMIPMADATAGTTKSGSVSDAQVDEPDSLVELVEQLAGDLDRQARLTDPTGTGQGQQRRGSEGPFRLRDLRLAADEGR